MKKLLTTLTAAALFLTLTACGKEDTSQETANPSTTQSSSTTQPTTDASKPESKFEEIVLVDNEDVTFKIIAVENDPIWGYTLKAFLENKTDLELMFTLENVSINGFMCDPFWATSVSSGKKSNSSISWLESTLKESDIQNVEEIEFTLRVYDNNDWLADDVFEKTFTINP